MLPHKRPMASWLAHHKFLLFTRRKSIHARRVEATLYVLLLIFVGGGYGARLLSTPFVSEVQKVVKHWDEYKIQVDKYNSDYTDWYTTHVKPEWRQRIEDELAWKFSAQRLVAAYQALLPGSPRPTEQRPQGRRRGRFSERHPEYVARRAVSLVRRYGISDDRAKGRVQRCVGVLAGYGVGATFATPGRVVQRSPRFFRELVAEGTELAVHGYDHVDFRTLSREETRRQFEDAAAVFRRHSIPFSGFRCPYLSFTEEVSEAIPDDLFSYGSNAAIAWEITSSAGRGAVYGHRGCACVRR